MKWWFSKGIPPTCPKNLGLGIIVSCPHISSIYLKCQIGVAGITWGGVAETLVHSGIGTGAGAKKVAKHLTSQGMTGALGYFWFSGWWFQRCFIFIPTWER